MKGIDRDTVMAALRGIKDPEIPVLNIVELGIVREVEVCGGKTVVRVTPTYSGCPAFDYIRGEIERVVCASGSEQCQIETVLAPAWSTEWLSAGAKEKLREYGIAPPGCLSPAGEELVQLRRKVCCPRCGGGATELRAEFSSTACKALWYCKQCLEPFEEFKAI